MGPSRLVALLLALASGDPVRGGELAWDARRAEHLLNRAGFGAGTAAIERAVALGPEAVVDELLSVSEWVEEPYYPRKRLDGEVHDRLMSLPAAERDAGVDRLHREDRAQSADFVGWWVERILAEEDPLRERMVLLWHGHFTSSLGIVKSSYEMIRQNQLFRRTGLGDFRVLLHEIVRDPAMLLYLDNDSNKKDHPNENFARELLELFTLGEGNYTEADVLEVARAFTGWNQLRGSFFLNERRHDPDPKRVLGVEVHDGDDVVEVLLAQEACARHVARAIVRYFEGVEPDPARLERYAAGLRADWRIDRFLRRLFLDPDFYRDEVRGTRISSPVDWIAGTAHRVGVSPDPRLVFSFAPLLGQRLLFPPTVRGWEGGEAWATSSALVLRGGVAGVLVGRISAPDLLLEMHVRETADTSGGAAEGGMQAMASMEPPGAAERDPILSVRQRLPSDMAAEVRVLLALDWRPRLNLTQRLARLGALDDGALALALVEEVLAVPAPPGLVANVAARLAAEREAQGLGADPWTSRPDECEPLLRELAHAVLVLPEAQLD